MRGVSRLVREPLVHFLAVGGLLFALYAAVSPPAPEPPERIVVTPARAAQLAAGFERVWRRPPTEEELRGLVEDFVREEVFYREALALGLDRDDAVVRRRLRQKMSFLADTGADALEPGTGELEAYLAEHAERYRVEPRIALSQVFLGEGPAAERIAAALEALRDRPPADPATVGERTMLPASLPASRPGAVDAVFGAGFFARVAPLEPHAWAGPVRSSYGVHLVRVDERQAGRLPALDEVRDAVERDWRSDRAESLREALYERLRARYTVEVPEVLAPGASP